MSNKPRNSGKKRNNLQRRDELELEQNSLNILIDRMFEVYSSLEEMDMNKIQLLKKLREQHQVYKTGIHSNIAEFRKRIDEAIEVAKFRQMKGLDPRMPLSLDEEEDLYLEDDSTNALMEDDPYLGTNVIPTPEASTPNSALPEDAIQVGNSLLDKQYKKKLTKKAKKLKVDDGNGSASSQPTTTSSNNTKKTDLVVVNRPELRYEDMGGIEPILQDIRELIEYPFTHPEIYVHLGVEPPRGILLAGPPGCGKTMLANVIAGELGVPFLKISAPEIVSGMSGESEQKIRNLFKDAAENAPSLIFIDEIDAIAPKRENASREMEKRIVAQFLTCMDEITFEKTGNKMVLVIGATNRAESLDPALRRAGRFDREITLGVPDTKARAKILEVMAKKLKLSGSFDFFKIAKMIPGYVGADIQALTKEAAVCAIQRIFSHIHLSINTSTTKSEEIHSLENRNLVSDTLRNIKQPLTEEQLQHLSIEMIDFEHAMKRVQPSSKREGFATVPDVTWDDVGALDDVREELRLAIMEPIKSPEQYEKVGLNAPVGVLLYGPPGCGKTLLAKAIANSSGANFISVKGPELLNKYVGESERGVRQVFQRASSSAPCIIFFDELDALCPKRGNDLGNPSTERVVNQLLTEMDGLESRKNVFVIGATNRPDIIDPAMLRPGRLDKLLYVPLPHLEARLPILKTLTRKTPLDSKVDMHKIASDKRCENFSGADLAALVREAAVSCLKENLNIPNPNMIVTPRHFEIAFQKVVPSVSAKDRRMYDKLAERLSQMTNHIKQEEDSKENESSSGNNGDKMET